MIIAHGTSTTGRSLRNPPRATFASLEAESSDGIVEDDDDDYISSAKLGKRDRNTVKEGPRTRQVRRNYSRVQRCFVELRGAERDEENGEGTPCSQGRSIEQSAGITRHDG